MNADIIAILGYVSFELSQRRRDAIRPNLHREFSTLCRSHVPVTKYLFADELQTQINHIRTSNKFWQRDNKLFSYHLAATFQRREMTMAPFFIPSSGQHPISVEKEPIREETIGHNERSQVENTEFLRNFKTLQDTIFDVPTSINEITNLKKRDQNVADWDLNVTLDITYLRYQRLM
ncbi:uncharacterized protein LOC124437439 [Xenia sp. Carnegie-2017]|uniref:uncharacterized protein LOC124437439 n=1 Tax=Xenia sp. Carnegie-2017 TaxID=2897299 RepID=UPI001F03FE39|nr:uncharacterized protein LOC124437439 [Xenia sp. Carnegie-2017]